MWFSHLRITRSWARDFSAPKGITISLTSFSMIASGKENVGNSLVGWWLRVCLAIHGMWVPFLVRKLRSHRPLGNQELVPQTEPHTLEPESHNQRACGLQLLSQSWGLSKGPHKMLLVPDANTYFFLKRNMVFKTRKVNHKVHMLLLNDWLKQVYLQQQSFCLLR